jgi:malonyl-CoA/methylmalonyl-CoA synthetase
MAVPTIYHRLIAAWDGADEEMKQCWSQGVRQLRLMVSGSAALPVQTLERWRDITAHTLLERYGMTEIGMALSNPLHGERRAGTVGHPLPGVQVRLVDDVGLPVTTSAPGEIEVRGAQVFLEYWRRPAETRAAFRDGWFATGDVALLERDYYRILGRKSVDIIKTAGFKVSALEIEEVLRTHPAVRDAAVVSAPDPDLGERVCAAVVADELEPESLIDWARERLAPYKVPRTIRMLTELPRNAMGKVLKPELARLFD